MKKIILIIFLFLSFSLHSQEDRKYYKVDENTYKVKVYHGGVLTQVGYMKKIDSTFRPHGKWKQYTHQGKLNVIVLFKNGKKISFNKISHN